MSRSSWVLFQELYNGWRLSYDVLIDGKQWKILIEAFSIFILIFFRSKSIFENLTEIFLTFKNDIENMWCFDCDDLFVQIFKTLATTTRPKISPQTTWKN